MAFGAGLFIYDEASSGPWSFVIDFLFLPDYGHPLTPSSVIDINRKVSNPHGHRQFGSTWEHRPRPQLA
jgi:hypothetical protein